MQHYQAVTWYVGFWSWIWVNYTIYGAWPLVTYFTVVGVDFYPARVMCPWAWQRSKKPLELSSHRDRQPERGASGWNPPRRGDTFLGLSTLEKPQELSSHPDWQPEWGASGWTLPRQGGVYLGLAMLEKPLALKLSPWPTNRVRGVGVDFTPPGWCVSGPGTLEKAPGA